MSEKDERAVTWISCLLCAWFFIGMWVWQYVPDSWPELARELYAASVMFALPLSMVAGAMLKLK